MKDELRFGKSFNNICEVCTSSYFKILDLLKSGNNLKFTVTSHILYTLKGVLEKSVTSTLRFCI